MKLCAMNKRPSAPAPLHTALMTAETSGMLGLYDLELNSGGGPFTIAYRLK